ncbi:hypothetical protein [Rhodopila sp.]|uniref:hypothetical protein n=1 Tax=Rhodopila sp. TaxID=2480087 RepID=UPI003D0F5439
MSISSVTHTTPVANNTPLTSISANPLAADLSSLTTSVQPGSGGSSSATGTAALFQQLTSDLQAFLVQMQGSGGLTSSPTAAQGSATPASASATDPTSGSSTTSTSSASQTQPHHHHHHEIGGDETGGGNLETDATNLLNDLTGETSSSGNASSAGSSSASAPFSSTSTSGFAAYQAYSSTGGQTVQPTQLGLA